MLTIRGLSKRYENGIQALDNVDLEVPRGMYGLLGPNGAGKSTLMRTIATLQDPDAGEIHLGEIDVLREKPAVRRILGYLPQEFGLYPHMSAEAMLDHLALLKGMLGRADRRTAVEALLRMTDLWEARRQRLGTFSGGMRQRFGVAQALIGNPQLVIVDEPTAGLDPEGRQRFLNLLSTIGEQVVVILSTHIVADVAEVCSRMAIIDGGRVRRTGDPRVLIASLTGRVWQRLVSREEIARNGNGHRVISTRLFAGQVVARIYSETSPGAGCQPVEPTLEDVYFTTLKRFAST